MQLATSKESMANERLTWHPAFNVYLFDNQDVLLISENQQWLLPEAQFPHVHRLDGVKTCQAVLNAAVESEEQQKVFYGQINQLIASEILIQADNKPLYLQPDFTVQNKSSNFTLTFQSLKIQVINLSLLAERKGIESVLMDASQTIAAYKLSVVTKAANAKLSFILVDDFLDPRIVNQSLSGDILVIKISGEQIWISPLYTEQSFSNFPHLQKRILDNQPVRKAAMSHWPNRLHAYPVDCNTCFTERQLADITQLLIAQLQSTSAHSLLTYHKADHHKAYHPVNSDLSQREDFEQQLQRPVELSACANRFNEDGGSRSVSPQATVEKLRALVSPITGVINHFREVELPNNPPVKVYRTGFFKTPARLTPDVMEQGFVQICMGKGVSPIQSQASALCEAVERFCAIYQSDVPLMTARPSELAEQGKRWLGYQALVPYSDRQYQAFSDPAHPDSRLKQAALRYDNTPIHWLPTWSLTHKQSVYVPLSQCFSGIPFKEEEFGRWHSNGCAAGNTLEEAILQGLFELIERDAVAIWWYNRLSRSEYDLTNLDQDNLAKLKETLLSAGQNPALTEKHSGAHTADSSKDEPTGYDFWVLDLTSDIGVPVMAAIGRYPDSPGFVMGFGCHFNAEIAAQRALTELCQLIPIRHQHGAPFDFDAVEAGDYLYPKTDVSDEAELSQYSSNASLNLGQSEPPLKEGQDGTEFGLHTDIRDDVMALVDRLKAMNLETLVLDYSRSHIPLRTAKVFVPGLCHIWPQLANTRLYQAPVTMGLRTEPLLESELNPQPLYI